MMPREGGAARRLRDDPVVCTRVRTVLMTSKRSVKSARAKTRRTCRRTTLAPDFASPRPVLYDRIPPLDAVSALVLVVMRGPCAPMGRTHPRRGGTAHGVRLSRGRISALGSAQGERTAHPWRRRIAVPRDELRENSRRTPRRIWRNIGESRGIRQTSCAHARKTRTHPAARWQI